MQELSQKCLSFARPMAVDASGEGMSSSSPQTTRLPVFMPSEELDAIIHKILDGDGSITHQDRRSLLKVFSKMIDGSTLGFAELSKRIEEGLKNAGVQVNSQNLEVGMMILDALAFKQSLYSGLAPESAKNDNNLTYFELRELENYKMDEELDQMCDRQSHRRHILTLLQAVQNYLQRLESETGDYATRIAAIDEAERKYSEAKARLNAEALRLERKAQNPKGSSGATSISKQPKYDHPSIVRASSSVFESGAKNFNTDTQGASSSGNQSTQQNVQQLNKVGVLTSFFGPRKEHKMVHETSKPAQEKNLFRSLGSHPVLGGSWTEEQALIFQEHLDRKKGLPPTKELWQELILSTKLRRNKQKNDDTSMVNARETAAGSDSTTQGPVEEHLDTKGAKLRVPAPRFVMIKAEDHLLNTLGYSGIFHPSAEANPEVCAKLTKDPLYKIPGIEYDMSDSDDEAEDAESIGSKDEEDEEMSNPSIDDEEKDDFIVPDGYLSDDEILGSNDNTERNLHLQKKPRRKKLEKLEMKIRNFMEDPASGSAYAAIAIGGMIDSHPSDQSGLESQQLPFRELTFPLKCTEAATEQDELNDEVIRELLKELHCSSNKGTVITKIGEKYKYVSKAEIKLRADESCVQAIIIDPLIYKKAGLGPQKYLNDLGRMFTPDLHCTEHRLAHALDEIALNLSDTRVNGHMSEKDLISIAISMNGLPGRTVLNAQTHLTYHNQNPGIKKVSIERKLKEVGVSLFIVRRDVYETYFDAEKPKPSGDQPSQAINPELSANDLEWEIQGEWFQSINKYFRSTDSHNVPNSGLQFGTQTAPDTTVPVEFSQRSMAQATPADSGKTSLSSKNKQLYSQEGSQGSFKNQDIRDLIKGSSGASAFEYSNPEDSRTRQFARPKTPLEKSFANAKETQSQGATLLASSSANPAVKTADLNVSKKTTGVSRSKDGPGQRPPSLALNRQEPVPEEIQEILNKKPPRPESQPVVPSSPRDRRVPLTDFKIPEQLLAGREQHPGTLDVENSSEEVQLQKVAFVRPALSPQSLSEVEEVEIYPSRITLEPSAAQPVALAGSPVSQAGSMTSATLAMCAGIKPSGADKSFANLIDLEEDDPDGASASGHSGIVPESTNRFPLQLGSLKTVPSSFAIQPENSRLQHTTKVDSMPAFNLDKLIEERNKKGQEEIKSRPKVQLKENRGGATKMDIEKASKRPTTMVPENQSISNSQSKVMQMFRVAPTMIDEASMGKSSNFLSVGLPVSQRDLVKATASGPVASKSDQQHKATNSSKNDAQHSKNQGAPQPAQPQPAKPVESPARKMQLVERRSGSTSLKRSDDPPAAKPKNSVLPFLSQSKLNQEKAKPKPDAMAPQHEVTVENLRNSLNDLIRRSRTPSPEKQAPPENSQVYKKPKSTKPGSKQSTSITQFIMTLPDESNSGQSGVIQVSEEGRAVQAGEAQGSPQQPGTKNKHASKNQAATKPAEAGDNGAKPAVPSQKSVKVPEVPAKPSKASSSDDEDANSSSKGPLTRSRASRGKEEPKPKEEPKKTKKAGKN